MDKIETAPIIIGKLMNIGGMLERKANRLLLQYSINHQQFSVLFEIGKAGKVKQKDMVNRLSLERAHVSKIIKKLQSMELVNVSDSDEDKRSRIFSLTTKGENILLECRSIFKQWNKEWIDKIEEKSLISILENLTTLQSVLKEKTQ
jgi:DNA-binding MarR family transcriptional regulator